MIAILSNSPNFILKLFLQNDSVKNWVYFGDNNRNLNRFEKMFASHISQVDYAKQLAITSEEKRSSFINWIDDVSLNGTKKKEWMFSVPAVKNPYSSKLFLYTCYFFVIAEAIKKKERMDIIIVESPAMLKLLKRYFSKEITFAKVNCVLKLFFHGKAFIKTVLRWGKYTLDFIRRYCAAKSILKTRARNTLVDKSAIVFIRNFISGNFSDTDNDMSEKHFFPDLYKYLKDHEYFSVFLSIAVQVRSYTKLFKKIRKSRKTIIFPEELLKAGDYIHALFAPLRAINYKADIPALCGYNFGSLMREEYYCNLTEFGFLYANLLSRFGKRLRQINIIPLGMINWSENQALEKGLIKGLREYFPDMQLIGSQPFIAPRNHLSLIPSRQEKQWGLIAEKNLVLGPIGKMAISEFVSDISIGYSPAFRYAKIFNNSNQRFNNKNVLVLMGYSLYNALNVIRMMIRAQEKLSHTDNVFIKLHPAGYFSEKKLLNHLGSCIPKNFSFVNGNVEEYLDKISVGVCSGTGTAIELVTRGIPVIVIGETHSLTFNYLSSKKDDDIWQLCFSAQEIVDALARFNHTASTSPETFRCKADEFRKAFFSEPSEKYWENFLIN